MRGRASAIWIGGIAAGIAMLAMAAVVVIVSAVPEETGFLMLVVAAGTGVSASWEVERSFGWKNFVVAVMIGLCLAATAAGVYYFNAS